MQRVPRNHKVRVIKPGFLKQNAYNRSKHVCLSALIITPYLELTYLVDFNDNLLTLIKMSAYISYRKLQSKGENYSNESKKITKIDIVTPGVPVAALVVTVCSWLHVSVCRSCSKQESALYQNS